MKRYQVIDRAVTISSGVLALSEKQASARSHCLNDLGKGLYQVKSHIQFKRGEEFGYDGPVSKAMLTEIADVAQLKKREAELSEGEKMSLSIKEAATKEATEIKEAATKEATEIVEAAKKAAVEVATPADKNTDAGPGRDPKPTGQKSTAGK